MRPPEVLPEPLPMRHVRFTSNCFAIFINNFMTRAMSAPATVAEPNILQDLLRMLTSRLPQLIAAWEKLEQSGFEHSLINHLDDALIEHALYQHLKAQTTHAAAADKQTPHTGCLNLHFVSF